MVTFKIVIPWSEEGHIEIRDLQANTLPSVGDEFEVRLHDSDGKCITTNGPKLRVIKSEPSLSTMTTEFVD